MFLLAYYPPSNIARTLYTVKRTLFRQSGLPSAIALPALVPLSSFEQVPQRDDLERDYNIRGHCFSTGTYRIEGNSIFLEVDMGAIPSAAPHHHPPLYHGFHILSREKDSHSLEEQLGSLDPPPELHWTGGEYCLLSLTVGDDTKLWWKYLLMDEVFSFKVLKAKKRKD
jgi:hypothetical protein